jgi:hypothetical protein
LLTKWGKPASRAECCDSNNLVSIDILIFYLDSRPL